MQSIGVTALTQAINSLLELVIDYLSLFLLFLLLLVGNRLAWKALKKNSYRKKTHSSASSSFPAKSPKKEYSAHELGIMNIDDVSALPPEEQKRRRMKTMIRDQSSINPEQIAAVIKGWMKGE